MINIILYTSFFKEFISSTLFLKTGPKLLGKKNDEHKKKKLPCLETYI